MSDCSKFMQTIIGKELKTNKDSFSSCTFKRFLGSGAQGNVYEVEFKECQYALKVSYFKNGDELTCELAIALTASDLPNNAGCYRYWIVSTSDLEDRIKDSGLKNDNSTEQSHMSEANPDICWEDPDEPNDNYQEEPINDPIHEATIIQEVKDDYNTEAIADGPIQDTEAEELKPDVLGELTAQGQPSTAASALTEQTSSKIDTPEANKGVNDDEAFQSTNYSLTVTKNISNDYNHRSVAFSQPAVKEPVQKPLDGSVAYKTDGAKQIEWSLCMLIPLFDGDLLNMDQANKTINQEEFLDLVYEITKGLAALHGRNIVHGDLGPHNVLVKEKDSSMKLTICDYGLSHYYKCPKRPNGKNYESDIRSLKWVVKVLGDMLEVRTDLAALLGDYCLQGNIDHDVKKILVRATKLL